MAKSGWRTLFANDALPDTRYWPDCLSALKTVIDAINTCQDLAVLKKWQPQLISALQSLDVPAWRISQVVSDHNDWIYHVAIKESLDEMSQQGWGEPPCDFCVLTLGSAARHESLLGPDQDNAMILEDYPLDRHVEIDTWFQSLAERFTNKLHLAGIPLCKGHVMARWPLWRKPLSEWCEQMRLWSGRRTVKLVQLSNILLDFAPVYGNPELADEFRNYLIDLMPRAGLFLDEMNALQDETRVALDRFDRLVGDDQDAPHQHAINLKRQGLLPLQAALRLFALRKGIPEQDCRGRLKALAAMDLLSSSKVESLQEALSLLLALLLESQMKAVKLNRTPDGWVDRREISESRLIQLKMALIEIRSLQKLAAIT